MQNFSPRDSFAHKLWFHLVERNMSQSALASKVFGTKVDKRQYTVAKRRDLISNYLAGDGEPDEETLARIAKALRVTADDLRTMHHRVLWEVRLDGGAWKLVVHEDMSAKKARKMAKLIGAKIGAKVRI